MNFKLTTQHLSLKVELINGDIEIKGEEREDIEIDFGDLRKNTAEEVFDITYEEGKLSIKQKDKKLSEFMHIDEFPIKVKVPSSAELSGSVKNVKGDIDISNNSSADLKIGSKNGDVCVKDIHRADLDINVISGDIALKKIEGKLNLNSINGDISVKTSLLTRLKGKSVSGDICIESELNTEDDISLNSVTGDILLSILKFSGESGISVNTVSGEVDISGEKPAEEKIRISQVKGEFAKFNKAFFKDSIKPMIKNLKHHLKDITKHTIKSEVHSSKKDNQNVQQILNMVSEGKITAEEAEKLISALK